MTKEEIDQIKKELSDITRWPWNIIFKLIYRIEELENHFKQREEWGKETCR